MRKKCFFIGPIGSDDSEIRDWSNQVLHHIVSPIAIELGYDDPKRSDLIEKSGSITFEIMEHLVEDELVIADLTNGNPNVFYELAIRHILQKPVIHLIKHGSPIPFDVHDIRVIPIRVDNLDAAEKAKRQLKALIISTEADKKTVIPHIIQIHQLKSVFESPKTDTEKEELVNLLEQLDKIRQSISDVKSELVDINSLMLQEKSYPTSFEKNKIEKAEKIREQKNFKK